jgi:hypothetical protein
LSDDETLPRVWVSFDFFGAAFDPDVITAELGVEPTEHHRVGEPIRGDKGRWPRDRWRITVGPRETIEIGAMLSEVQARLARAEDALANVCAEHRVESMLTCAVEPTSAQMPYILFPNDIVRWAGDHDVAVAVDVMLWRDQAEDDD